MVMILVDASYICCSQYLKSMFVIPAGKKFGSATAFSIHCKRMQTPGKQGDDGWKSTLYEGQPLDIYRRKYFQETGLNGDDAEVSHIQWDTL